MANLEFLAYALEVKPILIRIFKEVLKKDFFDEIIDKELTNLKLVDKDEHKVIFYERKLKDVLFLNGRKLDLIVYQVRKGYYKIDGKIVPVNEIKEDLDLKKSLSIKDYEAFAEKYFLVVIKISENKFLLLISKFKNRGLKQDIEEGLLSRFNNFYYEILEKDPDLARNLYKFIKEDNSKYEKPLKIKLLYLQGIENLIDKVLKIKIKEEKPLTTEDLFEDKLKDNFPEVFEEDKIKNKELLIKVNKEFDLNTNYSKKIKSFLSHIISKENTLSLKVFVTLEGVPKWVDFTKDHRFKKKLAYYNDKIEMKIDIKDLINILKNDEKFINLIKDANSVWNS